MLHTNFVDGETTEMFLKKKKKKYFPLHKVILMG